MLARAQGHWPGNSPRDRPRRNEVTDVTGIRAQGLGKSYSHGVMALEGVDLEVAHGECLGFLGPNGAGKTTFIRLALGIIRPTAGSVAINGHDLATDRIAALTDVGYVPGDLGLVREVTGARMLTALGRLHPRPPVLRERLLGALELDDTALGRRIITGQFEHIATFGATSLISAGSGDTFTARILADAPPAPTGASANAGILKATIIWNAVAGGLVSSYTATAAPGGAACTAVAPATTCTITNLTAGTSYTATVTATNQKGTSPPSGASNAVTPTAPVNTFTMKRSKIWPRPQKITTQLNLPGPGKVAQVGTTRLPTRRASSEMAKTVRRMTVCTARKTVAVAGKVTITCRLTAKARAARKTHALKVRLVTTFTPTGGTANSLTRTVVLKRTR